jgi:hypothetical protein
MNTLTKLRNVASLGVAIGLMGISLQAHGTNIGSIVRTADVGKHGMSGSATLPNKNVGRAGLIPIPSGKPRASHTSLEPNPSPAPASRLKKRGIAPAPSP